MIVEPALRVAVELDRRGLPAALAAGVLALLTTEIVEQSMLPHALDVVGVAEIVRRVPADRFDDYVAAVAAEGVLMRVEGGR